MKTCPKCGCRIRLWNLSQYCPGCKTNLMFYGFEERFYRDAKLAEMSLANSRIKLHKIKTGLVGGKLQYARLASVLLPLLALLVPFAKVSFSLPIYEKSVSLGLLGLISSFSDGVLNLSGQIGSAAIIGDAAGALHTSFFSLIAVAAVAIVVLLLTILSFLSFKKMAAVLCSFSLLGIGAAVFTAVKISSVANVGETVTLDNGFGVAAVIAAFAVVFVLNFIIAKNGLPIEYKPGDPERQEIRQKYKKKLISLDDIPYPIFQTEQEREQRQAEIEKAALRLSEKNSELQAAPDNAKGEGDKADG